MNILFPVPAEAATPLLVEMTEPRTGTDVRASKPMLDPDHVAIRIRQDHGHQAVTTGDFTGLATGVAKDMMAQGIKAGETLAIRRTTIIEWTVADKTDPWAGVIVVSSVDLSALRRVCEIVKNADASGNSADIDNKQRVMVGAGGTDSPESLWERSDASATKFAAAGHHCCDDELDERRRPARGHTATLIDAAGTKGQPKDVIITYRNLIGQILNTRAGVKDVLRGGCSTLIVLPLARVLTGVLQFIRIAASMAISGEFDQKNSIVTLDHIRAIVLLVTPRMAEKIRANLATKAQQKRFEWSWRDSEMTGIILNKAVVTAWHRASDLETFDEPGSATHTERLSEPVVTAGEKPIASQCWERSVNDDPLIADAVSDSPPLHGTVLFLASEEAAKHAMTVADLEDEASLRDDLVATALSFGRRTNLSVAAPEGITRVTTVLSDLRPGSNLVTRGNGATSAPTDPAHVAARRRSRPQPLLRVIRGGHPSLSGSAGHSGQSHNHCDKKTCAGKPSTLSRTATPKRTADTA